MVLLRLRGCEGWSASLLFACTKVRFSREETHMIQASCCIPTERRAARRISGYSDPEEENFPEPKPDYSDDDFELRPRCSPKKSPQKKKKRGMGVKGVIS